MFYQVASLVHIKRDDGLFCFVNVGVRVIKIYNHLKYIEIFTVLQIITIILLYRRLMAHDNVYTERPPGLETMSALSTHKRTSIYL